MTQGKATSTTYIHIHYRVNGDTILAVKYTGDIQLEKCMYWNLNNYKYTFSLYIFLSSSILLRKF